MENNVTSRAERITPEVAHAYLTHNVSNRPIKQQIVELYAKQMTDGLWVLSNDAITFAANGDLMNGQHRLSAVIKSGKTCDFMVTRNMPQEAFAVMDNGTNRSAGDVLFIEGITSYNNVASVVKRKMVLNAKHITAISAGKSDGGGAASSTKVGNMQIIDEYKKHRDFYDQAVKDAYKCYSKSRLLTISDYGGFVSYLTLCLNHPYETALSFFEEFCEIKKASNDVVNLLRQKYVNDKIGATRMTAQARQKLIIKAWNAYVTGKTVKVLKYVEANDKDVWFI